jgi:hypothetical protein
MAFEMLGQLPSNPDFHGVTGWGGWRAAENGPEGLFLLAARPNGGLKAGRGKKARPGLKPGEWLQSFRWL